MRNVAKLLHARTARRLRDQIAAGGFPTGELPTEAELCADFEVSRSTLRRALSALRQEGLLVSRQGSGWSVAPEQPAVRLVTQESTSDASGSDAVMRLIRCEAESPPAPIRDALAASAPRRLLLLERTSTIADTAVHRSETWFAETVGGHLDPRRVATASPARLLADLGWKIARFDQFAQAVISNRRDEELIGLPPNSPVMQVTRLCLGDQESPLFISLHRHPGQSTRVELDLPTTNTPGAHPVSLLVDHE